MGNVLARVWVGGQTLDERSCDREDYALEEQPNTMSGIKGSDRVTEADRWQWKTVQVIESPATEPRDMQGITTDWEAR